MLIAIIPRCARTGQSPPWNCCALVATNTLVASVGAFGIRWRGGELDDADVSRIVERRRSQLPKPKGFALPSGYAPSPGAALSAPDFPMKNQGGKFSVTPVNRDVCAEKPPVSERTIPGVVAFWRILRVIGRRQNARSPFTGFRAVGLQPSVRRRHSPQSPGQSPFSIIVCRSSTCCGLLMSSTAMVARPVCVRPTRTDPCHSKCRCHD